MNTKYLPTLFLTITKKNYVIFYWFVLSILVRFFLFFVYVLCGDYVAMEIIIKHLKFPSPVLYVCAARVRQHHQHNLVNIMFPEEKYIRKVIQGCFELGVQVSEELASVFVSVRCNQLLHASTRIIKFKIRKFVNLIKCIH